MSAVEHPLSFNAQPNLDEFVNLSEQIEVATLAPSVITDLDDGSVLNYANNDAASDRGLLLTRASIASIQTVTSYNSGHVRCQSESAIPTEDSINRMNRHITHNLNQQPNVDYIDQLDVTGIYGGACKFLNWLFLYYPLTQHILPH
jgi:hypothetical protein